MSLAATNRHRTATTEQTDRGRDKQTERSVSAEERRAVGRAGGRTDGRRTAATTTSEAISPAATAAAVAVAVATFFLLSASAFVRPSVCDSCHLPLSRRSSLVRSLLIALSYDDSTVQL